MRHDILTTGLRLTMVVVLLLGGAFAIHAQTEEEAPRDSIMADSINGRSSESHPSSLEDGRVATDEDEVNELQLAIAEEPLVKKVPKDWSTWKPDPQRALWLALVLPGGGQIYNRKYWKLPIIYGGFIGCLYAMNWNNNMYKDYSQAYVDITDNDPGTASYNRFLHLGAQINDSNKDRWTDIFKKRKDKYRRWRDLSFFVLVGVYALSVIDAYVDAELSVFDISKDLSLRVEPTLMNDNSSANPIESSALGLHCSLNF